MDNFTEDTYCLVCGVLLDTVSIMDGSSVCDDVACEDEYAIALENN